MTTAKKTTAPRLTKLGRQILENIVNSQYQNGAAGRDTIGQQIWTWDVTEGMSKSAGGAVKRLVELGWAQEQGKGKDATLAITDGGYNALVAAQLADTEKASKKAEAPAKPKPKQKTALTAAERRKATATLRREKTALLARYGELALGPDGISEAEANKARKELKAELDAINASLEALEAEAGAPGWSQSPLPGEAHILSKTTTTDQGEKITAMFNTESGFGTVDVTCASGSSGVSIETTFTFGDKVDRKARLRTLGKAATTVRQVLAAFHK